MGAFDKILGNTNFKALNTHFPKASTPSNSVAASVRTAKYGVLANNPKLQGEFLKSVGSSGFDKKTAAKQSAKEAGTGVGLGATRSLIGTLQGLSGIYDLATPGEGTSRVSKKLDSGAKFVDQTAKTQAPGLAYKAGQAATDLLTFAAPGGAAKAAGKLPGVAKAGKPFTKLEDAIINASAKKGKVAGTALRTAAPSNLLNMAGGTAFDVGQMASKGEDINAKNVALSAGMNAIPGVGLPIAASATPGVAKGAVKGAKGFDKELKDAGKRKDRDQWVSRQQNKIDKERRTLYRRLDQYEGMTGSDVSGTVKDIRKRLDKLDKAAIEIRDFKPERSGRQKLTDKLLTMQPGASTRAVTDKMPELPDDIGKRFEKHYSRGHNTPDEKKAYQYIRKNPAKALADYDARVKKEFDTKKANIVAGDEAKYIIPDFDSTKSAAYHEPGSALAKVKYDHLLADPKTKDKPVMIMAGGTGAGKTTALKTMGIDTGDFAAVIDTNSNRFGSAESKIEAALKSGRKVDIQYVYRDPHEAFKNGVIPRGVTQGRIVPVEGHIDTHYGSYEVIPKLAEKYKDNPNVQFHGIDNSKGKGNATPFDIANMPKMKYNRDNIDKHLRKEVDNALSAKTIKPEDHAVYHGKDVGQKPAGQPAGTVRSPEDGRGAKPAPATVRDSPNVSKQPQGTSQEKPVSGLMKIGRAVDDVSMDGYIANIKNKASKLYTATIDRYNPLIKAGKAAGQEDAMKNALASHYGAGSTATYHVDYELSPIFKGVDPDELRSYTIAKRDIELSGRGIKGSDAMEANKVLDGFAPEKRASLEKKAQELYKYQNNLVDEYLVKTGVLTRERADQMLALNKSYVPFKRVMDVVDKHLGVTATPPGSVGSQNVIKGIKGSGKQIVDPVESIIENTYKIVGLGKRQEVARTIVGLQDKLPGLIKKVDNPTPGTPVVSLFEDGKVQKYSVPEDIEAAAKALNEEQMNTIVKILAVPTRVFRTTATGVNPEFGPKNIARDLQTAFVVAGLNPLKWASGFAHYIKDDDIYKQFLKAGGQTSRLALDERAMRRNVKETTGKGMAVYNPKQLYRLLERVGEASEVPTRLALFEKELKKQAKKGTSEADALKFAARAAQEGTVNFGRRGSQTQAANALYAFMNARVQGTDRLLRALKENPVETSTRLGIITLSPTLALYAYNRDKPGYNDPRVVSDYDKKNNFIMMAPWLGKDRFIKVPKGDVGKLANPVEAMFDYIDKKGQKKDIKKSFVDALSGFLPTQNVGDVIPTALRPPVEVGTNKSFFTGYEVVPDYKKNYPNKLQDTNSTSPIYRQIGAKLNISPAQLEQVSRGYFTGFARIGENASTPVVPKEYKKPRNEQGDSINKAFVARGFVGGAKQSRLEYSITQAKRINSLTYDLNDLKGGLNRHDLTQTQYDTQAAKVKRQQQEIKDLAKRTGYSSDLEKALNDIKEESKAKAKATRARNKK